MPWRESQVSKSGQEGWTVDMDVRGRFKITYLSILTRAARGPDALLADKEHMLPSGSPFLLSFSPSFPSTDIALFHRYNVHLQRHTSHWEDSSGHRGQ